MKLLSIFLYLFFSAYSFGSVRISLEFKKNKISQGELVRATLKLNQAGEKKLQLFQLNRLNVSGILYIHAVNGINGSYDNSFIQADSSVIFLQIPTKKPIYFKLQEVDVELTWNEIEIESTNVKEGFYFPTFDIPEKLRFPFVLFLAFLGISLCVFVFHNLIKNQKSKKDQRYKILKIKETLLLASKFDEIIEIWKRKHDFISVFPHLESEFKKFELILFKHQFKPFVSSDEKSEVENAYKNFLEAVKGGFGGV